MQSANSFQIDTNSVAGGPVAMSYDALDARGRRRAPVTKIVSEDRHLNARKRQKLMATTQDAARNFAITAWLIRKHVDYVSSFRFQAKTPDRGFNKAFEEWAERVGTRHNFDVARKHSRRRMMRLMETRAVTDGDHAWLKLRSGRHRGKVQAIASDLIRMPNSDMPRGDDRESWINGAKVDLQTGEALRYALCQRQRVGQSLKLSRIVPARNVIMRGYYERAGEDQVRGVSPLSTALNSLRDTYEGFDYALAKLKTAQLFGLKIMRNASRPLDPGDETEEYNVDPNRGIFQLELDPGDDADFLEAKTPARETTEFLRLVILVALKAIDVPYSFFDESFTNFYGSRGGLIQYLQSCKPKREDNKEALDAHTRWRAGLDVADGQLELPQGKDFSFLRWEWVPDGIPWWDPAKEIRGKLMAIRAGLSSPQRECRETGTNFEDNLQEIADALKLAEQLGVDLYFGDGGGIDLESLKAAADAQETPDDDD
ncbi:MAG: phage portal protein [Planctomycetota bacterium]